MLAAGEDQARSRAGSDTEVALKERSAQWLRPGDRVRTCYDEPAISAETVGEAWMKRWGLADPLPGLPAGSLAAVLAVRDDEVEWQTGDGLVWTSDIDAVERVEPSAGVRD